MAVTASPGRPTGTTAYGVARKIDDAEHRLGLEWTIVPRLDQPYRIEQSRGHPVVYVNGDASFDEAAGWLVAAIDELDRDRSPCSGGVVLPLVRRCAAGLAAASILASGGMATGALLQAIEPPAAPMVQLQI